MYVSRGAGLTDYLTRRRIELLLSDTMGPLLKEGKVDEAVEAGVGAIVEMLDKGKETWWEAQGMGAVLLAVVATLVVLLSRESKEEDDR